MRTAAGLHRSHLLRVLDVGDVKDSHAAETVFLGDGKVPLGRFLFFFVFVFVFIFVFVFFFILILIFLFIFWILLFVIYGFLQLLNLLLQRR
jgi:hypothetical protein